MSWCQNCQFNWINGPHQSIVCYTYVTYAYIIMTVCSSRIRPGIK